MEMATQTPKSELLEIKDLTKHKDFVKVQIVEYFSREEIHKVIDTIDNQSHKMFITFLWMTGVRVTESISVRKKDLDYQNYLITIKWLKNRRYENRVIPMHPHLRSLMQLYTAEMNLDDFVFNISRQRAWQIMQKHFDSHPHRLRHSFAINWLKCGGEIVTLSRMLGHSDIKITMQYLQIVPQDQGKELLKITF